MQRCLPVYAEAYGGKAAGIMYRREEDMRLSR